MGKFKVSPRKKVDRSTDYIQYVDIVCNRATLDMLTVQTAGCLLKACNEYSEEDGMPTSGAGAMMAERLATERNSVGLRLRLALAYQAEFVYSVVGGYLENLHPPIMLWEYAERKLIADALLAFQEWKTALALRGHEPFDHDSHFNWEEFKKGATCACEKDWTKFNERLLASKTLRMYLD